MKNEQFYRGINKIPGAKKVAEVRVDKLLTRNRNYDIEDSIKLTDLYSDEGDNTIFVQRPAEWNNRSLDLSIIIPVYNTGVYLRECLDSVLTQQTKADFEVIIVDDGSIDPVTKGILDEYSSGQNNLIIVKQANGGLSDARNTGISKSRGRYLMFIDSDDYIPSDSVQCLYSAAIADDADIVEGAYANVDDSGKTIFSTKHQQGVIDKKATSGYAWGKLYRSSVFSDKQYPKGYWFEDSITKPIIVCAVNKISGISDVVYCYRRNHNSISFTSQANYKCLDSYYISMMVHRDRRFFSIPDDQYYYDELLNIVRLTFRRTLCIPQEYKIRLFLEWCDFMEQFLGEFQTEKPTMKKLERALKDRNYYAYDAWCKLYIG